MVLVVAHDGEGDGGARGSRGWQWVARKLLKNPAENTSLGEEESTADWGRGLG